MKVVLKSELLYIVWRSLPAFLKKNLIILEKIMNFSYTYVLSTKLTVFLPNSKSSPVIGWTEIPVVVQTILKIISSENDCQIENSFQNSLKT